MIQFAKIKKYIKSHKIISAVVAIVLIGGGYLTYASVSAANKPTQYILGKVTRGTISQTVSGSGQVKGVAQIDLHPQGSGQVVSISATQGQILKEGQTIATIDERGALVSLVQARASVESAQANYNKVVNGATSQTIAVSQTSLTAAKQGVIAKILNAYNQTNSVLLNNVDMFFNFNNSTSTPVFGLTVGTKQYTSSDYALNVDLSYRRGVIAGIVPTWKKQLDPVLVATSTDSIDITSLIASANSNLSFIASFLNQLQTAYNLIQTQNIQDSSISSYGSNIASARNTIGTAITDIASAEQSLSSAQASYNQQVAPARPEDVATAKAQLDNAEASLMAAENSYENNLIKAPFDGLLASLNIQKGQIVSSADTVGTMTTQEKIVDMSLNEVDAAKIIVGDPATITFDALPNVQATGKVIQVSAVGTVTSGVVNYDVKISLDSASSTSQIDPGMSANVIITTSSKSDILVVPSSAVTTTRGKSYIKVLPGIASSTRTITTKTTPQQVPITVGVSNDTQTEITGGLNEGDQIIVRTITTTGTTNTTNRSSTGFGAPSGTNAGALRRAF